MSMIFTKSPAKLSELRAAINVAYRQNEDECVAKLLPQAQLSDEIAQQVNIRAYKLAQHLRNKRSQSSGIDSLLHEYDLSNDEGVALMCLAEALLRIPDKYTIDKLIRDKITGADWKAHLGNNSFFVNAASWALLLTGNILKQKNSTAHFSDILKKLAGRLSAPVIRVMVSRAINLITHQFVIGETIEQALERAQVNASKGYRYSYDMLGETARTMEDAQRYFQAYDDAITAIGKIVKRKGDFAEPGLSVKLSALHPRYEFSQHDRVLAETAPKLFALMQHAMQVGIGLTIDAEEASCLDLSLDLIEQVFPDPALAAWHGFGIAVQSYQKRAWPLIDWVYDLAKRHDRLISVRLIKGAYWDSEIKTSQQSGLSGYPVFTRKVNTDVSFQACAKKILDLSGYIYPQFATHNVYNVALIQSIAGSNKKYESLDYEFQCLHGMGETLYHEILAADEMRVPCRIYAPVGNAANLLSYLVRRLLENGANNAFVNRIYDTDVPVEKLIADPVVQASKNISKSHPAIVLPQDLYPDRKNSPGIDLSDTAELQVLAAELNETAKKPWRVAPIAGGLEHFVGGVEIYAPHNRLKVAGMVQNARQQDIDKALQIAYAARHDWAATAVAQRCQYLENTAELLSKHYPELMVLLINESGKTLADALAEIREAIDFCRYYARQARQHFEHPLELAGYTGESNQLSMCGRGVMLCISPWNFPLAIFMGQVTASLAAGNCVIAKPAAQTPLIAGIAIRLLHAAGIPDQVLHLLPGSGASVAAPIVADHRCAGVLFTGSTATARTINQILADRSGPIVPLIAETGGQNVMVVDSSALLEQVVVDIIRSAFGSAGQRCSALRVLFIQNDIADQLIAMLQGAMAELNIGDPGLLATDIGPIIDVDARMKLEQHAARMQRDGQLIYQTPLSKTCTQGTFFAPRAFEIKSLAYLPEEIFGPVLHVIRYSGKALDSVIKAINDTGYGLTLGIHSRINETIDTIHSRVNVGNIYVNRDMTGAVVGVQPFGGEGLSGTGPKAGGPHYLQRLSHERCLTINTAAAGGNISLIASQEEN